MGQVVHRQHVPKRPIVHPLVAYHRVSTANQGRSGLGLEAQRAAVEAFAKAEGFDIVESFTEVETGKGSDALDRRPQLGGLEGGEEAQVPGGGGQARQIVAETWPSSPA